MSHPEKLREKLEQLVDIIELDDGPIAEEAVEELNGIAQFYLRLAEKLEAAIASV